MDKTVAEVEANLRALTDAEVELTRIVNEWRVRHRQSDISTSSALLTIATRVVLTIHKKAGSGESIQ